MTKVESAAQATDIGGSESAGATQRSAQSEIFLTLNHVIDASLDKVYAAWTDPEMLQKWLAPGDAVVTNVIADAVVGGTFLVEILASDGKIWRTRGEYREVEPQQRLIHTWIWEGSDVETLVTVEFEPESTAKTRLTLTHSRFAKIEAREEHERGWSGCLTKLEALWTR